MARPIGTAATTRLRRVACEHECGYVARVSRRVMLLGIAACPCGGRVLPSTLEDAQLLADHGLLSADDVALHPESEQLSRELDAIARGRSGAKGVAGRTAGTGAARTVDGRLSDSALAWKRVMAERRADALARQRDALKSSPVLADQAAEPIPF